MEKKLIAICIATYKRQELLGKLLSSIFDQEVSDLFPYEVSVLICDNDVTLSANPVFEDCLHFSRPMWMKDLEYLSCAEKGLVNVRNCLVECALKRNADFVLFVDDDEYVSRKWLTNIMKTYEMFPSDAVIGPVLAYFEKEIPKTLSKYFERNINEDGSKCDSLITWNTLIPVKIFRDWGLRFDSRFNLSGGEDSYLGIQILQAGGRMVYCADALAYEMIPEARMNLRWVLTRNARTSATWLVQRMEIKRAESILYAFAKIAGLLCLAIATSPLLFTSGRHKYDSPVYFAKCYGTLKGFCGVSIKEYK